MIMQSEHSVIRNSSICVVTKAMQIFPRTILQVQSVFIFFLFTLLRRTQIKFGLGLDCLKMDLRVNSRLI